MDEWGRDPSIRAMRRVFRAMEKSLDDLLEQLDISPFDHRIRSWLEQALARYELAWKEASHKGIRLDEKMASALYDHCLVKVIGAEGIKIPENQSIADKDVESEIRSLLLLLGSGPASSP
jgi:hypothetical protein